MDKVVNVNFRLKESYKKRLESACADRVMSVSTALTIFSKIVGRKRRIPFEISADMFYSESNMAHLRRGIAALVEELQHSMQEKARSTSRLR